jgi:2,4-dienoyl-CoA reductase-like NADH-dependent reductase (Old Yellow Enzyme family)
VQLHAANGYLVDQFLRDGSNGRADDYGGPVANRIRLPREVTEVLVAEAGAGRTHVRLSPSGAVQGVNDSDPLALFTAAAVALGELGVASLELREPGSQSTFLASDADPVSPEIRRVFGGRLVLNSDYVRSSAEQRLAEGVADAISFGRPFLANPDLVERLRAGATLNAADVRTFYSQGRAGYLDYPTLQEQQAA